MKNSDINLLIETYIAYVLSMGHNLEINEIKKYAETLKGYSLKEDSFKRKLRERKDNLIMIGALKKDARIHTNISVKNESSFLKSDYTFELKPFSSDYSKHIKRFYPVVLLLNTCHFDDKEKNINEVKNKYRYFYGDTEDIKANLFNANETLREMFETFEIMQNDSYSKEQIRSIKKTFDRNRYTGIFECVAAIKMDPDFGYEPGEGDY